MNNPKHCRDSNKDIKNKIVKMTPGMIMNLLKIRMNNVLSEITKATQRMRPVV